MERTAEGKYGELNAQMAGWSYGRFDVPTGLIKSPEEKYRARVAKQENVDALLKSILQFGTVNEHVHVVLLPARAVRGCESGSAREDWVQAACDRR